MIAGITPHQWQIMLVCAGVGITGLLVLLYWCERAPLLDDYADTTPSCITVSEHDIEPPVNGMSAAELKLAYLEAERILVESHSPTFSGHICRVMAGMLMEGADPKDAVIRATTFPHNGKCPCDTCCDLTH